MKEGRSKRRTFQGKRILLERNRLDAAINADSAKQNLRVDELKNNPLEFFRQILGFEPFAYQKELIRLLMEAFSS